MAQAGNEQIIATDATVDFTGALAQNVSATLRKALPASLGGRSRWRSLSIVSVQNLDWEVWVFRTSNAFNIPAGGTLNNLHLAGRYRFFAADGLQVGITGSYFYYIDGMDIPYHDMDSANSQLQPVANQDPVSLAPFINIVLVNRNAVAKIAGPTGAIQLRFGFEATNA